MGKLSRIDGDSSSVSHKQARSRPESRSGDVYRIKLTCLAYWLCGQSRHAIKFENKCLSLPVRNLDFIHSLARSLDRPTALLPPLWSTYFSQFASHLNQAPKSRHPMVVRRWRRTSASWWCCQWVCFTCFVEYEFHSIRGGRGIANDIDDGYEIHSCPHKICHALSMLKCVVCDTWALKQVQEQ